MAKQKIKWTDTEEIAFRLIDAHPQMDPLRVRFTDLHRYVTNLADFNDNPKKSTESILEAIQMRWHEERAEMEDELGPVSAVEDDEALDEDDYRDDDNIEDEEVVAGDGDEEDEDEFGDGFQEEEVEDDR